MLLGISISLTVILAVVIEMIIYDRGENLAREERERFRIAHYARYGRKK